MTRDLLLLPQPQRLVRLDGHFEPAQSSRDDRWRGGLIRLGAGDRDALLRIGGVLKRALAPVGGGESALTAGFEPDPSGAVVVSVDPARVNRPEGYRLSISPEQICLVGHDEAGVFYGAQTLTQIARQCRHRGRLPCLLISDWPDLPHRGVQLDISRRRIPTMESLKGLVDRLAHFKVNQFQLYTEHTFAYRNHPAVWRDYSPMTGEQILELDRYCRERYVELVPNQNTFGHMERWLHRPRYEHLAEGTPETPIQYYLNPADPRSLALIEELLDELLPHFSSRQAMAGLDEVNLGKGKSAELCRQGGGPARVYLDYLNGVHRIVGRHGKTMQYFADVMIQHTDFMPQLPTDAVGLIWGYEEDFPFHVHCAKYADAGLPFYTVPGTGCWGTIGGNLIKGTANQASAVKSALEFGAAGCLVCNWGDGGHWQPLAVTAVGYAYGAGVMWALEANREMDLAAAVATHLFEDSTGRIGDLAVSLGNACLQLPSVGDWSAFQGILQQKPGGYADMAEITPADYERAYGYIEQTMATLGETRMDCADADVVADEFRIAAHVMQHACRLGKARREVKGTVVPDMPRGVGISHILPENETAESRATKGNIFYWPDRPGDAEIPTYGRDRLQPLVDDMASIVEEYRRAWLLRNRSGGLDESVARFEKLLALYRSGCA